MPPCQLLKICLNQHYYSVWSRPAKLWRIPPQVRKEQERMNNLAALSKPAEYGLFASIQVLYPTYCRNAPEISQFAPA